jgi:hypothetical protein
MYNWVALLYICSFFIEISIDLYKKKIKKKKKKVFFSYAFFYGDICFLFLVEEYMESKSSIENQFLCVDCDSWKDSDFG